MLHYLLMCKSLTYAQRAARLLERSGVSSIITKAPKSATNVGCNYCIKVKESHLAASLKIFYDAGLGPVRVFLVSNNGNISEVNN